MIDTKRLILVSVFYFVASMIVFFIFVFAVASVFSMVDFEDPSPKGSQVKSIKGEIPTKVKALFGILFFAYIWLSIFMGDQSRYITMVSASTYYFNNTAE